MSGGIRFWFTHSFALFPFASRSPSSESFFTDLAERRVRVRWLLSLMVASFASESSMPQANRRRTEMAKRGLTYERIKDQSESLDRVDPKELARALGAGQFASGNATSSPFSMLALRSRLISDIVSTGGRPARREAALRKIPVTDAEWTALDEVAGLLRQQGVKATPGQVAGLLVNQSLAEVLRRLDSVLPASGSVGTPAPAVSNADLEETLENVLAAAAKAEVHLEELRPVAQELLRRMSSAKEGEKR